MHKIQHSSSCHFSLSLSLSLSYAILSYYLRYLKNDPEKEDLIIFIEEILILFRAFRLKLFHPLLDLRRQRNLSWTRQEDYNVSPGAFR